MPAASDQQVEVYQCKHCLTVYDEAFGEPSNHIPPGTSFASLPAGYCCPLCESPISDFKLAAKPALLLRTV
ncbi:rubredoxin [Paraflavitalea speifideaquila]|uniref:rubredoxin n=1 Tax=Paraflavitalea speifideaquila TaxID=3076558 RepID=UPI0033130592